MIVFASTEVSADEIHEIVDLDENMVDIDGGQLWRRVGGAGHALDAGEDRRSLALALGPTSNNSTGGERRWTRVEESSAPRSGS